MVLEAVDLVFPDRLAASSISRYFSPEDDDDL